MLTQKEAWAGFTPRPYQARAFEAARNWLRTSTEPCIIDAAPAAGKSWIIAMLADWLHAVSDGKRVLALAPSSTLVEQNAEKFASTGHPYSIFSASAGAKSTRHFVVFATPGTVKNAMSRFTHQGTEGYCAVIVDEAHGITPTIRAIIEAMRIANPQLRVIGLTGTPYRLGSGYIFREWPDGRVNGDDTCRDPYFAKCVYRVTAQEMLADGFITPMRIGAINADRYDTSGLVLLPNGHFQAEGVERAFVGHGRKTAGIVADVIHQAQGVYGGVMLFAASVAHAREIMASLPPGNSSLVTGDTPKAERKPIIARYRAQEFRYLVSVGTLTTGFDVEHTSIIATLRQTESSALLQQILGRAWRLDPRKCEGLWLDYAGNHEAHFPDGDIYSPVIKAGKIGGGGEGVEAECPECGCVNQFTRHKDAEGFTLDANGYCLDTFGERIQTEHGPMPGHYGRRCFGHVPGAVRGTLDRCSYFWTSKECEGCGEKNDIAARRCSNCKAELVDPNAKLIAEFKAHKKDPYSPQTDRVVALQEVQGVSAKGNRTVRVDWTTPYRQFATYFLPESKQGRRAKEWSSYKEAMAQGRPQTVSYVKDQESGFFRVLAYNREADVEPNQGGAA